MDDMSSDDDVLKEKSNNSKSQTVTSSMGFGKDIKGSGADVTDDVTDDVSCKWTVFTESKL